MTVPASVTVPAGQTSATFTAQTSTVTATTPVVVSASLGGTTVSTTLFLVVSQGGRFGGLESEHRLRR